MSKLQTDQHAIPLAKSYCLRSASNKQLGSVATVYVSGLLKLQGPEADIAASVAGPGYHVTAVMCDGKFRRPLLSLVWLTTCVTQRSSSFNLGSCEGNTTRGEGGGGEKEIH